MNYELTYFLFACVAIIFSVVINGLFLRFSRNLGMRNLDDSMIRWATSQKPALGGFSFYILFLVSVIAYVIIFDTTSVFHDIKLIGVLIACTLGFFLGLTDDAYNTRPVLKFVTQFMCGIILIATGTVINFFDSLILNYILTLFWVVGIMNSINMLDNMDAITTNVSIFIILSCILVNARFHDLGNVYLLIMIGVAAGLAGFLFFNWNPSKMYMGDTGSQFLGVFLSAIGIIYLWNAPPGEGLVPFKQIIVILIAFLLPIVDTTTVTINRLRKKQSPFVGGRDHTTHHLSYYGLSDKQVALFFISISLISLFFNYLIHYNIEYWYYIHTLLFAFYALLVFIFLFYLTQKYKGPKKDNP